MPKPRITVVGGVVIDLRFEVPRWPSIGEAIQGVLSEEAGGKGLNQAVATARLGAQVSILSALGDDPYGYRLRDILHAEGIKALCKRVSRPEEIATDMTAVILKDGQPGFIGCRRATNHLTAEFIGQYRDEIGSANVVMAALDVSEEAVRTVIALAKQARRHIILNAAPSATLPLNIAEDVDYVVLTATEARRWVEAVTGKPANRMSEKDLGGRILRGRPKCVIITEGRDSCTLISANGRAHRYEAARARVIDDTGVTDAFCAGLAIAVAAGKSTEEQMRTGLAVGALAAARLGSYRSMPSENDLE